MASTNSDGFASSFPIWVAYFLFFISCLISLARTLNNMLNKSDENGHPGLIPDLRIKLSAFSPLSIMLTMHLSFMACIKLRYIPLHPLSWEFLSHGKGV